MRFKTFASAVAGATADLQQMRGHIAALRVEIDAVKRAPLARDEAIANVDSALDTLAYRVVHFDTMQFSSPLFTAAEPELAQAITHRYLRAAVRASIVSELDRELDKRPPGLPAEGRAEKLSQLEAQLFEAERAEEEFILQARAAGMKIARRPDADPRAILGVEP
jgi:hypothetical protein